MQPRPEDVRRTGGRSIATIDERASTRNAIDDKGVTSTRRRLGPRRLRGATAVPPRFYVLAIRRTWNRRNSEFLSWLGVASHHLLGAILDAAGQARQATEERRTGSLLLLMPPQRQRMPTASFARFPCATRRRAMPCRPVSGGGCCFGGLFVHVWAVMMRRRKMRKTHKEQTPVFIAPPITRTMFTTMTRKVACRNRARSGSTTSPTWGILPPTKQVGGDPKHKTQSRGAFAACR